MPPARSGVLRLRCCSHALRSAVSFRVIASFLLRLGGWRCRVTGVRKERGAVLGATRGISPGSFFLPVCSCFKRCGGNHPFRKRFNLFLKLLLQIVVITFFIYLFFLKPDYETFGSFLWVKPSAGARERRVYCSLYIVCFLDIPSV